MYLQLISLVPKSPSIQVPKLSSSAGDLRRQVKHQKMPGVCSQGVTPSCGQGTRGMRHITQSAEFNLLTASSAHPCHRAPAVQYLWQAEEEGSRKPSDRVQFSLAPSLLSACEKKARDSVDYLKKRETGREPGIQAVLQPCRTLALPSSPRKGPASAQHKSLTYRETGSCMTEIPILPEFTTAIICLNPLSRG